MKYSMHLVWSVSASFKWLKSFAHQKINNEHVYFWIVNGKVQNTGRHVRFSRIFAMFSSFRLLEGRPERGWSSMLKSSFLKRENHSNPRARLRACSLKASWSISNDSVCVFSRRKQNFKQVLCFFKSDITISTRSQKVTSRKLTVRPIELLQEDVRLATDSWGSREEALTLSFSHSSTFDGLETSLISVGSPHVCRTWLLNYLKSNAFCVSYKAFYIHLSPYSEFSACIMEQEKWMRLHIYACLVQKELVSRRSSKIRELVVSLWKLADLLWFDWSKEQCQILY